MYVALVQYLHLVSCVVVGPDVIPSLIVPNIAPQKVPLPIQDEHGDVMEDSECVDGVARWMHAIVLVHPNGCFINTWSEHTFLLNVSQEIKASIYSSWGV